MKKTLRDFENEEAVKHVRYYSDQGHDIIPVYFENFEQIINEGEKDIECIVQLNALKRLYEQDITLFQEQIESIKTLELDDRQHCPHCGNSFQADKF